VHSLLRVLAPLLSKNVNKSFLSRKQVQTAIHPLFGLKDHKPNLQVSWRVCGVRSNAVSSNTLRGHSNPQINQDPGTGYSCGLWLLFHYLSGYLLQNLLFLYATRP
jgi:hypothetical protein